MEKRIEDYLVPTDPPAPFPAISTYQGENTLSSSETVGEVTIKGRFHRQVEWTNLEWAPYPSLSFVALSEPVHLLPGKYYAWQNVIGTADFGVMVVQPEDLTGGTFGTDGYYTIDVEGDYCLQINKNSESKTYTQAELDALSAGSGIELKTQRMIWTDMAWEVSPLDTTICTSSHIHLYPGWYVLSQSTITSFNAFVIQFTDGAGSTIFPIVVSGKEIWPVAAEHDYFIQINKRGGNVTAAELEALVTNCTVTAVEQTAQT